VAGSAGGTAQRWFRASSQWNVDGSVFKSFPLHFLGEQSALQSRFEFVNAFNHTNFGSLSTSNASLSSPSTFGVLTPPTSGDPYRIIVIALKLVF
jgi:hypothetical protein